MVQLKWLATAVAMVFVVGTAQAGLINYSQAVLADNPIIYYQFEELTGSAAVNSGTIGASANGTYTNVVLGHNSAAGAGLPGLGVCGWYNGANDNTRAGTTIPAGISQMLVGTGDYSIEVWFKPEKGSARGDFFSWNTGTNYRSYTLCYNNTADNVLFYENGTTYASRSLMKNLPATNNAWHHYVVTRTSGSYTLYLDGVKTVVGTNSWGTVNFNSQYWDVVKYIGRDTGANILGFQGPVDEFAFYTYALSEGRVQAHYAQALIPEPSTIALLASGLLGLLCYAWRKRK
jgi:hypothetical protein